MDSGRQLSGQRPIICNKDGSRGGGGRGGSLHPSSGSPPPCSVEGNSEGNREGRGDAEPIIGDNGSGSGL